jgi:hypothetical protein
MGFRQSLQNKGIIEITWSQEKRLSSLGDELITHQKEHGK